MTKQAFVPPPVPPSSKRLVATLKLRLLEAIVDGKARDARIYMTIIERLAKMAWLGDDPSSESDEAELVLSSSAAHTDANGLWDNLKILALETKGTPTTDATAAHSPNITPPPARFARAKQNSYGGSKATKRSRRAALRSGGKLPLSVGNASPKPPHHVSAAVQRPVTTPAQNRARDFIAPGF